MNDGLASFLTILLGLAGGIVVGSALVAFLTVLDVIPRLCQLTRSFQSIYAYEFAVASGAVFWTLTDFFGWQFSLPVWVTGISGLFAGCFVGLLAAGLTEVLNVIPILAKRIGISDFLLWLLLAMVLGKIFGSLFDWIIYQTL